MAEQQNYDGGEWTAKIDRILRKFGWERRGDLNVDVPSVDGKKEYGIDGVYAPPLLFAEDPRVVLLEAKHYASTSLSAGKLEEWSETALDKMDGCNGNPNFHRIYGVPDEAFITDTVVCLWVHDEQKYDEQKIDEWISTIKHRSKHNCRRVWFVHNSRLSWMLAVKAELERLTTANEGERVFFYPSQGGRNLATSTCVTLEAMLAHLILAKGKRPVQTSGGSVNMDENSAFYWGPFDQQAAQYLLNTLKEFQFVGCDELRLYHTDQGDYVRNAVSNFSSECAKTNPAPKVIAHTFDIPQTLPQWVHGND